MSEFQNYILAIDDPRFDEARREHDNKCISYSIDDADIPLVDQDSATVNTESTGSYPALDEAKMEAMKLEIEQMANQQKYSMCTPDGGQVLRQDVEYIEDQYVNNDSQTVDVNQALRATANVSVESTNLSEKPVVINQDLQAVVSSPKADMSKLLKYGALAWLAKIILFK